MNPQSRDESFDLESVLLRAEARKGARLSEMEVSKFKKLCAEHAKIERTIEELLTKEGDESAQIEKQQAEILVQRSVEKEQKDAEAEKAKRAILAERAVIKAKLRILGFQVKDDGLDSSDMQQPAPSPNAPDLEQPKLDRSHSEVGDLHSPTDSRTIPPEILMKQPDAQDVAPPQIESDPPKTSKRLWASLMRFLSRPRPF